MRYDKEAIRSKLEWEGDEGITWFKPSQVPKHLEELWSDALEARTLFNDLMDLILTELEDD